MSIVKLATAGAVGFDANEALSLAEATAFKTAGKDFCIRYIPRNASLISGNLTSAEIQNILEAGLSLMVVQHCPLPGWEPSGALGTQYGKYAVAYAASIGLSKGIGFFLDLEEVALGTPTSDTINYCQSWFAAVQAAGYVPGLYVGYNCGLSPDQLYKDLSFKHYWKAYNYDDGVSVRGFQLIQHSQQSLNKVIYDPNTLQADNLGDLPMWLSAN